MKVALITGASSTLGSAICYRLANCGLHIIAHTYRRLAEAERLVSKIQQAGGSAETVVFDVTDPNATRTALEILLHHAPIQVLVNNAGTHVDAPLAGMNNEQWSTVIEVNLNGFFNVTQPLLLPMMSTRWGRIINISSIAGLIGNRGQVNYAAAKAGLHGATKSLALELASRGITVNAVAPGIIASSSSAEVFEPALIRQLVPMKRAGTPEEVAALVNFLVSEEAGYISGQVISINGGMA